MFLTHDQESWKVTTKEWIFLLNCHHEEVDREVDTHISLHVKHAADYGNQGIDLIANDTNVMVLCVSNSHQIGLPIFHKLGNQSRMTYINTSSISNAPIESVSTALPRFNHL